MKEKTGMVKTMGKNRTHCIQNNNCILENEWIMARNISTKISDVARSQYESRIIMNCKNNPKTFWSYVKKKTNKPGDVSTLEDNHGQLITSDITMAKLLNNYFSYVFVKDTDINFLELNVNQSISDTIVINRHMILEAIDKLNASKAPGPDGIHARIIKECKESFSTVFHVIFKKWKMEILFDCIYLDFAKAFDRVSHQRLLTKLYNIDIRGNLMNWIKDFLKGREQRVVVNNEFSDWASVVSGIPQGSVLGPSLFTIFINDIPNDITPNVNFFADDKII